MSYEFTYIFFSIKKYFLVSGSKKRKRKRRERIMRTAKRRVLSFIMAMLTVITTVFGHVDYTVKAETTASWTEV